MSALSVVNKHVRRAVMYYHFEIIPGSIMTYGETALVDSVVFLLVMLLAYISYISFNGIFRLVSPVTPISGDVIASSQLGMSVSTSGL